MVLPRTLLLALTSKLLSYHYLIMTWCFFTNWCCDFEARGVGGTTGTETVPDLEEGRICALTDVGDESWLGRELAEDAIVDPRCK